MGERLPQPEQEPRRLEVDIMIRGQKGMAIHTFRLRDTYVQSFDDEWAHVGFVAQHAEGDELPRLFYNFKGLGEYLIQLGFQHEHHEGKPSALHLELYTQYEVNKLDHEVGDA